MGQRLATAGGNLVERPRPRDVFFLQMLGPQGPAARTVDAGIFRHTVQILVGQKPLRQRRKGNHARAHVVACLQEVLFHPAVEEVVGRLIDEKRNFALFQKTGNFARLVAGIGGNPHVKRLALPDGRRQRICGFFQRRFRVIAVRIEDIDVIEVEALQALVEAGEQRLARATTATVRAGPHIPARLGGDDQLVAVGGEILFQHAAEIDFRRAGRRAVIIGEIEMGNAQIESLEENGTLRIKRRRITEIVPQAKGDGGQLQAASAHAAKHGGVIAIRGGRIGHVIPHGKPGAGAHPANRLDRQSNRAGSRAPVAGNSNNMGRGVEISTDCRVQGMMFRAIAPAWSDPRKTVHGSTPAWLCACEATANSPTIGA